MWRGILSQLVSANLPQPSIFGRRLLNAARTACKCEEYYQKSITGRTSVTKFNVSGKNRGKDKKKWQECQPSKIFPSVLIMAAAVERREDAPTDTNPHDNKDIAELMKRGRHMLGTKCRLDKVEEVYTEALHLALQKKDKSAIAFVQDQLANLSLRQGKLEKAEKLFHNVIKNLLDTGMKQTDAVILEISLKLATIYASVKNDDFATTGYEWVIEACRENLKNLQNGSKNQKIIYENHLALLGMSLDSYGRYLYMRGKHKKALDVTKESCKISTELFGENDIRTLVLFNDIAAILSAVGNYGESAKVIEKAIQTALKMASLEHSDVAIFWLNLSSVYKKQGRKREMSDAFHSSRKEAKLSKDKNLEQEVERIIKQISEL